MESIRIRFGPPSNRRLHSCAFGQRLLTSRSQSFSGVKLICRTALGKLISDRDRDRLLKFCRRRSNRGSKVIGDHFENLFSIYRRDFLKVIADHFSLAITLSWRRHCCVCRQLVDRSTLGQFNLGQLPKELLVHWENLISDRLSRSLERLVAAPKGRSEQGVKCDRRSF
jgi:hypothetical protein